MFRGPAKMDMNIPRTRPRPKSDFFMCSPTHQRYPSIGNVMNQSVVMMNPPDIQTHFTLYPLPGGALSLRAGLTPQDGSNNIHLLPLLSVQDLRNYFNNLNDLTRHPQIQFYNEFLRYIYPPGWVFPNGVKLQDLDPRVIDRLRSHIMRTVIQEHWLFWLKQVETMVDTWDEAVDLMGNEVKNYTSIPFAKRSSIASTIDLLDTYATRGINEYVEWNLVVAIRLMEHPVSPNEDVISTRKERARFVKLMEKMHQAKEKRKMWERKYRGYD